MNRLSVRSGFDSRVFSQPGAIMWVPHGVSRAAAGKAAQPWDSVNFTVRSSTTSTSVTRTKS